MGLRGQPLHTNALTTVEAGPLSHPHWRPALHSSAPAAIEAELHSQLHWGAGGGSAPYTSAPTAVVAGPHSQLGQGPAKLFSVPAVVGTGSQRQPAGASPTQK